MAKSENPLPLYDNTWQKDIVGIAEGKTKIISSKLELVLPTLRKIASKEKLSKKDFEGLIPDSKKAKRIFDERLERAESKRKKYKRYANTPEIEAYIDTAYSFLEILTRLPSALPLFFSEKDQKIFFDTLHEITESKANKEREEALLSEKNGGNKAESLDEIWVKKLHETFKEYDKISGFSGTEIPLIKAENDLKIKNDTLKEKTIALKKIEEVGEAKDIKNAKNEVKKIENEVKKAEKKFNNLKKGLKKRKNFTKNCTALAGSYQKNEEVDKVVSLLNEMGDYHDFLENEKLIIPDRNDIAKVTEAIHRVADAVSKNSNMKNHVACEILEHLIKNYDFDINNKLDISGQDEKDEKDNKNKTTILEKITKDQSEADLKIQQPLIESLIKNSDLNSKDGFRLLKSMLNNTNVTPVNTKVSKEITATLIKNGARIDLSLEEFQNTKGEFQESKQQKELLNYILLETLRVDPKNEIALVEIKEMEIDKILDHAVKENWSFPDINKIADIKSLKKEDLQNQFIDKSLEKAIETSGKEQDDGKEQGDDKEQDDGKKKKDKDRSIQKKLKKLPSDFPIF